MQLGHLSPPQHVIRARLISRGFRGDVAKLRADHSRENPITDQKNAEDTAHDREDLKAGLEH